jgi:hypothetical protein
VDKLQSGGCKLQKLASILLGSVPASDGQAECRDKNGSTIMRRVISANKDAPGKVGIIYQIELRSGEADYAQGLEVFLKVARSFKTE